MNISMYMIEEALSDKKTELIMSGEREAPIESIRLFEGWDNMDENTLYVERSCVILGDDSDSVSCVHGSDRMVVYDAGVNEVFNRILSYSQSVYKWKSRLDALVVSNCLLKEVLDYFKDKLPFPLLVMDNGHMLMASASEYGPGALDDNWDRILSEGSFGMDLMGEFYNNYRDMLKLREAYICPSKPFPNPSYVRNIYLEDEYVGSLILIMNHELTEIHKVWFDQLFESMYEWMKLFVSRNDILLKKQLFEDLISGDDSRADKFAEVMDSQGWRENDKKRILVASGVSGAFNANLHVVKVVMHSAQAAYAIEYKNDVVILLNETMIPVEKLYEIIQPILQSTQYYSGASHSFFEYGEIGNYYMQGRIALEYGTPRPGTVHRINSHVLEYLVMILKKYSRIEPVHPAIHILRDYDRRHGTNLYDILDVYLKCCCNQTKAAEELFLHRNTLIRKIEKIEELCDIDLGIHETRLYIMFSFKYDRQVRGIREL